MIRAAVGVGAMAALLTGCKPLVPPVPGQGGPAWIELTSPHFTVWTDGPLGRARELVRKMERLRLVLVNEVYPTAPEEGRDLAIVLRDDAELRAFSDTDESRPFAVPAQFPLWQPMIALSASTRRHGVEVSLAHELVHAISSGVVDHQPRWFAEGMATYFQTMGLDPDVETVEIGGWPNGSAFSIDRRLPIAQLFAWTSAGRDEGRQYLSAWALFLFLINRHGAELQRYMHLLDAAGGEVEQRPALARQIWDLSFPTLPFTAVDRALQDWFSTPGRYLVRRFRINPYDWPITERRLGDADVYAIRALLGALAHQDARARGDAAAALAIEPTHVLARLLAAGLDHTEVTAGDARAIAGAHEDDWRAWLLVAAAVRRGEAGEAEAEAARVRACEMVAANPALRPPPQLCSGRSAAPSDP